MARKKEQIDPTKLRYVLYARKSTEDEGSQVRSLKDQIKECKDLASRQGLFIKKVIEEAKSAKSPNNRPKFSQMLQDIEGGEYDAILCWHPDRLARNMIEAGKVIDMLDTGVLKDLKFVSHTFSNDANGKMLLGMLFVFSKQYSEALSEKVIRGHDGNLEEGKSSGAPKWGYNRGETTGLYEPDENFELVQKGWEMRAGGASLTEVSKYWKDLGVKRHTKINDKNKYSRPILVDYGTTVRILKDPIYYGLLQQAGQEVDLRLTCPSFTPMITEETYAQVQALGAGRTRGNHKKNRAVYYPLRGMVFCGVCGGSIPMRVGKNKQGGGKHVLSFRCDTEGCSRTVKSVRAKYIFEPLYEELDNLTFTDAEYKDYSDRLDAYTEDAIEDMRIELRSKSARLDHLMKEAKRLVLETIPTYKKDKNQKAIEIAEQRLEDLNSDVSDVEPEIEELKEKIENANKVKLTKDEFLNLTKTLSDKIKNGSIVDKDILIRILLLNLTLDDKNSPTFKWREPFAELIKLKHLSSGVSDGT